VISNVVTSFFFKKGVVTPNLHVIYRTRQTTS